MSSFPALDPFYVRGGGRFFIPDSGMCVEVGEAMMSLLSGGAAVLIRGSFGYYIYPCSGLVFREPVTYVGDLGYLCRLGFSVSRGISVSEYRDSDILADALESVLGFSFYLFCSGNYYTLGLRSVDGMLRLFEVSDGGSVLFREYGEDTGEMFVSDIKEHYEEYGLPREFAECLPEYCESCGAPLEIRETLTGLHCSNPRCVDKIVKRIETLCTDLNILYFGESTIQKFVEDYNITNPMEIFALAPGMPVYAGATSTVSDKIIEQIQEKKRFLLWEYVMYSNLPHLKTNARKIFQGYESFDDAYRDIENGGIEFVQEKLGLVGYEGVSVQAMKVYKTLIEYKEDLFDTLENVEIVHMGDVKEINVVCSDEVGGIFRKKAEFYDYVKKNYGEKAHFNFLPSVSKSIDYLVWKGADGSPARYTSKVKTVKGWNARGITSIPIVTAEQFIGIVRGM